MKIPRILLAAGSSGSGKTLLACGIMQALKNKGLKVASFKCGPDYIDPMFHEQVIGTKSANLDTFLSSRVCVNYLLQEIAMDSDIAVIEGVMGYYDGIGGVSTKASAYDVADATNTPVVLLVNAKGMSLSVFAQIKGFMEFQENSHIAGVIFNQMSPGIYPEMKKAAEQFHVNVLGYVPTIEDCVLESRHLGLVMPGELPKLQENLQKLAKTLEKTLDLEGIIRLADSAQEIKKTEGFLAENPAFSYHLPEKVKIGVAKDEAFCFFYKDNFRLLKRMGAELVTFSPLHDEKLPEGLDGLLLYGGYPELYAKQLSENEPMRKEIRKALKKGLPCMAECGGFMYLHQAMEDMEGVSWPMAGVIDGKAFRTEHLVRFGYVLLEELKEKECGVIPAHEFHYFDSTANGTAFLARKASGKRSWECIHEENGLLAGFPHLYYFGNPKVPRRFLMQCEAYRRSGKKETA